MSPVSLSHPEWDVSIRSYVLRTNYEEYAVILMKKKSSFGPSTTLKLYGTSGYGAGGQAGSGVGQRSSETPPEGPLAFEGPGHGFGSGALDQLVFGTTEAESYGSA